VRDVHVTQIDTDRLILTPMSLALLDACLAGEIEEAGRLLGTAPAAEWLAERTWMERRRSQLQDEPGLEPWLLRAVIQREQNLMVGHVGFHTAPGPAYLLGYAPGGVEIGYSIHPEYRSRGYATEALSGMITWARDRHKIHRFVLSIRPDNEPSQRMARRAGFVRVGEHWDDEDGLEEVHVLDLPAC
jgi:ribosomal-protein-alanine N-acetyltransferase